MNWFDYQNNYLFFDYSICQLNVVTKIAYSILNDFPENLPSRWKDRLSDSEIALSEVLGATLESGEGRTKVIDILEKTPDFFDEQEPGLIQSIFESYFSAFQLGIQKKDVSYVDFIYVQQLIMTYAHLDSFMGESIRSICKIRPEVLKSQKQLDWETIIEAGEWEKVLDILIDKYVFDFGWGNVINKLDTLKETFGIDFEFQERVIQSLRIGELVRNQFVHNSGLVNQKFIDEIISLDLQIDGLHATSMEIVSILLSPTGSGRVELNIGDSLDISREFSDGVSRYARAVGGELFVKISEKFFDKKPGEISGIHRFEDKLPK